MSKKSDAAFNKRIDAAILRLQREGGLALANVFAALLKDDPEMALDYIRAEFFETQFGHIGIHAWATVSNYCANDGSDDEDDHTDDDPDPQAAPELPGGEAISEPIVIVTGPPGVGKSGIPQAFAEMFTADSRIHGGTATA
jgi:hypothetical protein